MKLRESGLKQTICSAKAGFSQRSGRNLERKGILSSSKGKKVRKHRNDPLAGVWEGVL